MSKKISAPWGFLPNKVDDSIITLRAKFSIAVYCNRSCLWLCLWVCYHDNSKLRAAAILTKLGL